MRLVTFKNLFLAIRSRVCLLSANCDRLKYDEIGSLRWFHTKFLPLRVSFLGLNAGVDTNLLRLLNKIITKKTGIEPVHAVLKTAVLPLNYISLNIEITGLAPSLVTYSK